MKANNQFKMCVCNLKKCALSSCSLIQWKSKSSVKFWLKYIKANFEASMCNSLLIEIFNCTLLTANTKSEIVVHCAIAEIAILHAQGYASQQNRSHLELLILPFWGELKNRRKGTKKNSKRVFDVQFCYVATFSTNTINLSL